MSNCSHSCGCSNKENKNCGSCGSKKPPLNMDLLKGEEKEFLMILLSFQYLPVVRFLSIPESKVISEPIFLETKKDSVEKVNKTSVILKNLEKKGFIVLDFEIPLTNCTYEEYYNYEGTKEFKDYVAINKGSIAPSRNCMLLIEDAERLDMECY